MILQANKVITLFACLLLGAAPLSVQAADTKPPVNETKQPAKVVAKAKVAAPPLKPLPGMEESVPVLKDKKTIRMLTNAGEVVIEVYPAAAPHAVQRFLDLVKSGFYNDTPMSRVVPGFVAQFGINWREGHKKWENNYFKDDESKFALERGTLAFAKAGADTNATQVFINYTENNRLAVRMYNFTTFGKVVRGMEVVDSFAEVGEPGMGLDQDRLWNDGEAYLKSLDKKPTMIISAEVVK